MSTQMFTVYQLHANHCVMLWKHKGEEKTVPALKELKSNGKYKQGNRHSQWIHARKR